MIWRIILLLFNFFWQETNIHLIQVEYNDGCKRLSFFHWRKHMLYLLPYNARCWQSVHTLWYESHFLWENVCFLVPSSLHVDNWYLFFYIWSPCSETGNESSKSRAKQYWGLCDIGFRICLATLRPTSTQLGQTRQWNEPTIL